MEETPVKLINLAISRSIHLAVSVLSLSVAMLLTFPASKGLLVDAHPAPPQAVQLSCSSDDMRRHWCPADTRGGVDLVRQRSEARCVFNSTWGYDDRGIWVDRGCRADFAVRSFSPPAREERYDRRPGEEFRGWGESYQVYCASDDMNQTWCPADTRFGVSIVRQRSEAACVQGTSWGFGRRGIWVDRGCRADFRVAGDWQNRAAALFYCASDDMGRHGCRIDTRDGVFIVRQRSEADCIYNRTWGYGRDGIWVDRGCRADFEVIDRRSSEWRDWDADDGRDRDRDRDRRDRDDRPPNQQ
jgi:Protein of unknown function (DUF3011)